MKSSKSIRNFFTHDSSARNDEKLLRVRMRFGAAGYGVYFMLLERLREETNYTSLTDYEMIAFDLRESTDTIRSVVEDFGLFEISDDGLSFWSPNFLSRMEIKDAAVAQRRSAAQSRWKRKYEELHIQPQCKRDATVMRPHLQPQCEADAERMQQVNNTTASHGSRTAKAKIINDVASNSDAGQDLKEHISPVADDISEFLSPNTGLSDLESLENLSEPDEIELQTKVGIEVIACNNVSNDELIAKQTHPQYETDATAMRNGCDRNASADARREKKRIEEKRKKVSPRERLEKAQRSAALGSPSLKDVEELMAMESLPGDAKQFFNYYEARGWQLDGEPVYDWKALLRSWSLREKKLPSTSPAKPNSGVSKELENIAASEKRRAAEEQARKAKEMEENPNGLTSAQILAQVKKKHGINPDQPITAIQ